MKFVFFGYDFSLNIAQRLIRDGHECLGILSFECDNVFNFNTRTRAFGMQNNIPVSLDKPRPAHLDVFLAKGCGLFISAGYPYKIPPVAEDKAYAINLHPSYLPMGRGLMPMPHILLHAPEAAGITVHKMTEEFDAGDILYQEKIKIAENEDIETLGARIAMRSPDIISEVVSDLQIYWRNATPQEETKASYWPPPDDEMRLLDWNEPVSEILKRARAFGRFGSLARIDNLLWVIYNLNAWQQPHKLRPGTITLRTPRETVVAVKDGFVCLKDMAETRMPQAQNHTVSI